MLVITKILVPSCKPDQDVYSHRIVYYIYDCRGRRWQHYPLLGKSGRSLLTSSPQSCQKPRSEFTFTCSPRSFTFSFVSCRWFGIFLATGDPKSLGFRYPRVLYYPKQNFLLVNVGLVSHRFTIERLAVDKPTSIKISQEMEDGKLMNKVSQLN